MTCIVLSLRNNKINKIGFLFSKTTALLGEGSPFKQHDFTKVCEVVCVCVCVRERERERGKERKKK